LADFGEYCQLQNPQASLDNIQLYSVFHRHGSLRVQNYEHPDVEGVGVPRSGARGFFFCKVEFARELEHQAQEQQGRLGTVIRACQFSAS